MDNPGLKNLGDVALAAINAATSAAVVTSASDRNGQTQGYIDRLEGMLAAAIQVNFNRGTSGGTSVKVMIETSLDQGQGWVEVARFGFTTSNAVKTANLSGLTPVTTVYTPADLSDDTVKDGLLGPLFRARILTVGTYVGAASLAIRLIAR